MNAQTIECPECGLVGTHRGTCRFSVMRTGEAVAILAVSAGPPRCACGRELDENGEHDGGYGAWCS